MWQFLLRWVAANIRNILVNIFIFFFINIGLPIRLMTINSEYVQKIIVFVFFLLQQGCSLSSWHLYLYLIQYTKECNMETCITSVPHWGCTFRVQPLEVQEEHSVNYEEHSVKWKVNSIVTEVTISIQHCKLWASICDARVIEKLSASMI